LLRSGGSQRFLGPCRLGERDAIEPSRVRTGTIRARALLIGTGPGIVAGPRFRPGRRGVLGSRRAAGGGRGTAIINGT